MAGPGPGRKPGRPLKFAFHLESGYAIENCLAIYDELRKRKLTFKS